MPVRFAVGRHRSRRPVHRRLRAGPRRDGNWEVQMQMEMPGMPPGMPPFTSTQCITPEEAKDPEKSVPQGRARARPRQSGLQGQRPQGRRQQGDLVDEMRRRDADDRDRRVRLCRRHLHRHGQDGTGRGDMTMKYLGEAARRLREVIAAVQNSDFRVQISIGESEIDLKSEICNLKCHAVDATCAMVFSTSRRYARIVVSRCGLRRVLFLAVRQPVRRIGEHHHDRHVRHHLGRVVQRA